MITTLLLLLSLTATAAGQAPWGKASVEDIQYQPHKVLYDVSSPGKAYFEGVLDRASFLSKIYNADPFDASIVLVLHGDEIPFFAIKNYSKYKDLMQRAQSLTVGGVIQFRMCKVAAQGYGFKPEDIHGFVKMVPMADAEIVRLQQEEHYAYMR